jgi:ribosomal protein S18 acetylase RimI-like enzyme
METMLGMVPETDKLEVVFHNPVHLPWLLPGCGADWHPCMPGVDVESTLYPFLHHRGWQDFARQNLYHRRLAGYTDPPALAASRARLLAEGIQLTLYDPTRHSGLSELFDNIRNPGWKAQVLAHTDQPIVVAVDLRAGDRPEGGLVVSYTGPLSVEGCPGRGNFCGIGTRTEYRGRGIGKLVFCEMCRRHAQAGATFMSLYTGDNNPARHIYEAAGFEIIRSFADMRLAL